MNKTNHTLPQIPTEIQEKVEGQGIVAKEGKVLPVCYRCAQVPGKGLYDGFRVGSMFFCSDCQQELFMAEQGSPEYQEFLFIIKGLLLQEHVFF
ncbi:conserved hypothetical protein [Candidatus Desulfosporosinus infrequens]|uniref:Inhibitor of sigma-G Gin n=1 Tax=Candidatus Desulfosporosinus infrequens TaxID=2043169 RepID=A0A2U3JWP2_9FIRM|nr:conserved hypothetical protein [Candidatus Desulfosporosinus infrequens]